jgi:hypothetical protein
MKTVAKLGASGFLLYDPTVGDTDTNYANLEMDTSSTRVRFSIYGDRSLTYGSAVTVTGVDDGTYPDQVRFLNSSGLAWYIDSTHALLPATSASTLGSTTEKIPQAHIKALCLPNGADLTISSGGAITVDFSSHRVDTYGGAASDNLDTINGGLPGMLLTLRAADTTHDVVVRHNVGNIRLAAGDTTLSTTSYRLVLQYDAITDFWYQWPWTP